MCTRVESPTVSAQTNLEQLLIDETLLPFPDVAEKLGVPVTKVGEDGLSKFVSGAITVLFDGGYDADEILAFLFTPDESLPGRPVDALHGQKAREVIRRAQAMAF